MQDLSSFIQVHCLKLSGTDTMQEDPALYVPAQGSRTQNFMQTFDLNEAIQKFLSGKEEVTLLLGAPGAGKSLFAQSIVQQAAQKYKPGDRIPLFISLPTLRDPKKKLMEEALKRAGFPLETHEALRASYEFFIVCDAYDELSVTTNFYLTTDEVNGFDKWRTKLIFTCKTEYLGKLPDTNFKVYFQPYRDGRAFSNLYQEIFVAPFSLQQISSYIAQYLLAKQNELRTEMSQRTEFTEEWLDANTYIKWINEIPGLKSLVQNPFLLKITMQVLPNIVIEFQKAQDEQTRFNMTSAKLYDAFIKHWFTRQEERLMGLGKHPGGNLINQYMSFTKALAKKMHEKNIRQVRYEEEEDFETGSKTLNEWSLYFSDEFVPQDKNEAKRRDTRILLRKGCPLKNTGENQWAFIHDSLLDYFIALVLQKELMMMVDLNKQNDEKALELCKHQVNRFLQGAAAAAASPSSLGASGEREYVSFIPDSRPSKANDATDPHVFNIRLEIPYSSLTKEKILGSGGFGKVYKGVAPNGPAAIKELLNQNPDTQILEDFKHEASIMAGLRSPYIVQFYGICFDKPHYSLVMEYLPNGSLFDLLYENENAITWQTRYKIAVDVGCGMEYLHSQGVVHADLKSPNILLDNSSNPKISDFGLSRLVSSCGGSGGGSKRWMGPELFTQDARPTKESDVYAFSVVLSEIGTRTFPLEGIVTRNEAVPIMVRNGTRPAIAKDTPPKMAALMKRCWDARAENRPKISEAVKELKEEKSTYKFNN